MTRYTTCQAVRGNEITLACLANTISLFKFLAKDENLSSARLGGVYFQNSFIEM